MSADAQHTLKVAVAALLALNSPLQSRHGLLYALTQALLLQINALFSVLENRQKWVPVGLHGWVD